jgi:hypothetical protein
MRQSLLSHSLIWDIDAPDQVEEFWVEFAPTLQLLIVAPYSMWLMDMNKTYMELLLHLLI